MPKCLAVLYAKNSDAKKARTVFRCFSMVLKAGEVVTPIQATS